MTSVRKRYVTFRAVAMTKTSRKRRRMEILVRMRLVPSMMMSMYIHLGGVAVKLEIDGGEKGGLTKR